MRRKKNIKCYDADDSMKAMMVSADGGDGVLLVE